MGVPASLNAGTRSGWKSVSERKSDYIIADSTTIEQEPIAETFISEQKDPTRELTEQPNKELGKEDSTFGLGSDKETVNKLMGTPDSIQSYEMIGDIWGYGLSQIDFDVSGKVKGWSNHSNNLYLEP
ncbi:hypothetical protein [Paenibacillus sp. CMAA1364]